MAGIADPRVTDAMRAAAVVERCAVYPLQYAPEAFAARVVLARGAQRTLDVQYYIWNRDTTGYLLLAELWDAAERGVRVRLLLDDNGIGGLDPAIAALQTHANIEVRLFNPFPTRRFKALGYLTHFRRLNRRMHNKSFTVDATATIVGGRNVGDEYFGAGQKLEFADLDVLAAGSIAPDVVGAFERYWHDESVHEAERLIGRATPQMVSDLLRRFAEVRASPEATEYLEAVRTTLLVEALEARDFRLERAGVALLCDPPEKVRGRAPDANLLFSSLMAALREPERRVDLISPYFVPGRKGTEALTRFAERGIGVRILTNSLSATDVGAVHAGYAKWRRALLVSRAKLYELKRALKRIDQRGRHRRGRASSSASLHAKTVAVDGARIFVGSFNLDPRSMRLNTEMGLVIESTRLAEAIMKEFDRVAMQSAYEVVLTPDGRELHWVERTPDGEVRHRTEPETHWLRRLVIAVIALLPIEGLL